jgi:hypothetical protein
LHVLSLRDNFPKNPLMLNLIRENINGILGTLIFHLLVIVVIMVTRLSSETGYPEHAILVEFETDISEDEFREFIESLMSQSQEFENQQFARNIAVNIAQERPVADEFRQMSQEQLNELDRRMDEILRNAAEGIMPELDQPEMEFELPSDLVRQTEEEPEPYQGPTTIKYDLPGRTHLRMPVPVYKCPDGGIVEVSIAVNQQGRVIRADINQNPGNFNERCIFEMAMEAATGSIFDENRDAPPVQSGTITFYFQKQ